MKHNQLTPQARINLVIQAFIDIGLDTEESRCPGMDPLVADGVCGPLCWFYVGVFQVKASMGNLDSSQINQMVEALVKAGFKDKLTPCRPKRPEEIGSIIAALVNFLRFGKNATS